MDSQVKLPALVGKPPVPPAPGSPSPGVGQEPGSGCGGRSFGPTGRSFAWRARRRGERIGPLGRKMQSDQAPRSTQAVGLGWVNDYPFGASAIKSTGRSAGWWTRSGGVAARMHAAQSLRTIRSRRMGADHLLREALASSPSASPSGRAGWGREAHATGNGRG